MSYHGFRSLAEPSLDVIMDGEFDCPNQTGILLRGAYGVSNEHHAGEPNHSIALCELIVIPRSLIIRLMTYLDGILIRGNFNVSTI